MILNNKLWRAKFIAFAIHLICSIIIISIFMGFVTQIWYPGMLFSLENVWEGLRILLPVDAILGPLLTLVLFVPGKKGLILDLIIIGVIQLSALFVGGYLIYLQKPEIIAFTADRFEIIPSIKYNSENFAAEYFSDAPHPYPHILYALPAQNKDEEQYFITNNVQYQKSSERYRPLIDHKQIIISQALDLNDFAPTNDQSTFMMQQFKSKYNTNEILLFILEGTTNEARILILDKVTLAHRGYLDIDPWKEFKAN